MNNQPCMTKPTLINLNLDEYNHGLCYCNCLFMINFDRCNRGFNTFDNPSGKIQVPNKTEDINSNILV